MKKTLTILFILLLSCLVATLVGIIGENINKKIHPMKYSENVEYYSKLYDVPEPIIYAVIKTESSFKADAVSPAGAIGLMQITPDTFEWLCTKTGETYDVRLLKDPDTNIRYGTYFLSLLHNEFRAWETVYAAYNAGRTRVNGWLDSEEYNNSGRLKNIPIKETREYVEKVTKRAKTYEKLYFEEAKTIKDAVTE
ncbi:MAG: lytic transglycosylase domain-containing protein [Ruminococcaceae bacterium]|nr:lytic transglycosylase domain-containing protein [Oscillospiraceae bacterium]